MTPDPHGKTPVLHGGCSLGTARLAIILLHGRGGTAEGIFRLTPMLPEQDVAYFAPEAAGHSWYPLSFMETRESNEPYLSSAIAKIHSLVESIVAAGFPRNRIVIAGFSQGACLATEYVFRHPAHYAGLIAFTGGLIGPPNSVRVSTADHSGQLLGGVPALLCSGDPDPHVPWGRVQESADVLTAMGASVELRRFPGRAHTVSPEELTLANQMLVKLLLRTPA